MGLKIKSMYEVLTNLIDWITARTTKITDFNVGSAARTLSEAIAIQFEEFYFAMKQNVLYAIENAIYDSFDFSIKSATTAKGSIRVNFYEPLPSNLIIPAGTVFCTSDAYGYIYYQSDADVLIEAGNVTGYVNVTCMESGTIGNVPAGAITTIVTTSSIIKTVVNEAAFTSGTNEETSADRKKRFQKYIKTLSKGTVDAITYGTLEVEGVTGVYVDDNYIGYVLVYAHNSDGNLPEDLRQAILDNLYNYRAAGIEVEVLPIIKLPTNLSLEVIISNDYEVNTYNAALTSLVVAKMNEYSVADNFYVADIIHSIKLAYDDVVVNVTVTEGSDVITLENQLIKPGLISINCIKLKDWRS